MRIKLYSLSVLLLMGSRAYPQVGNPAETLRTRKQYQNTLAIFKERQIFPSRKANVEIYRVFIAPTFGHPFCIRAEKRDTSYFVFGKDLTGQGGYRCGRLKRQTRHRLSEAEWLGLIDLLKAASFWTLPSEDEEPKPDEKGNLTICVDGASWYLEGAKSGRYQAVDRNCPALKAFQAVGLYMLKLSKLRVRESEHL
jgi:hypothetical protein